MLRSPYDLGPGELDRLVHEAGEPAYRARQVARWLDRGHVAEPAAMTDLPAGLRAALAERWSGAGLRRLAHQAGDDGWTHKFLFGLADGQAVETVLMFYPPAVRHRDGPVPAGDPGPPTGGGRGRATVCISTQAGCALGCTFCATGQFGFTRNLTVGEVVEQVARVWAAAPSLRPDARAPDHVTNVVFMGMGEPFANARATWGAAWRLHDGFGLSARALTISTVGLVPQIRRAATEPLAVNLAVSIHAPDDELRDRLVPLNRTWPIAELLGAVEAYVHATRRRVSFEYALLAGVNDSPAHGDALGRLLAPLRMPRGGGQAAHVNAIPFNPTPHAGFRAPSRAAARRFKDAVAAHGVPVSVRANRGLGIDAACGQLRTAAGRPGRTPALPLAPAGPPP
ncbi:MAG TPA: 23S rRNA (adenine(2503)-C(2))-methyltransferase RlmN [Actinomycetes bacterium]|nr:23S rRNA (adenine(2503)-C(2))-methyltransferase RlmN [Actinomycetes bacterium]